MVVFARGADLSISETAPGIQTQQSLEFIRMVKKKKKHLAAQWSAMLC